MEKRTHWKEIRNTHFVTEADITPNEGEIFASICIDAWETDHDWEEGKVIAEVILSKHGDILVSYRNPLARVDEAAQASIEDAKEQLRKYWMEEKFAMPSRTLESLLHCRLGADVVFLQKLKAIPVSEYQGCYQFMRMKARSSYDQLVDTLTWLAHAGVILKDDAEEYITKIHEKLVQEFAGLCPPPEGKHYEFAGEWVDVPMLRIVDNNI